MRSKALKVSLTDRDVPSFNHGGGTVQYQGSNIIPVGAHLWMDTGYTIKVKAIDTSGAVVGSGEKTSSCCPQ